MDEGYVGFSDLAAGEHVAELAVGAVVFSHEDDTAGLLVQAMHDTGTKVAADVGKVVEVVEEGVDEGAAVAGVVGRAGAGVDHHAGGLVDNSQIIVFIKDIEGDILGFGVERGWVGCAFDSMDSPPWSFCLGFAVGPRRGPGRSRSASGRGRG